MASEALKWSPRGGPFTEAAAFVREAVRQGRMTPQKGLQLTELAYRNEMLARAQDLPVDSCIELPEQLKAFPGATNPDGSVRFSQSPLLFPEVEETDKGKNCQTSK